jgi:hypothetical protein
VRVVLTLFLASLLFGCSSPEPGIFQVDAGEFKPTGAVLELYGVESPMEQNGKTLVGRRSVKSDGSGKIIVNFEDKPPIICHIGYVTNGLQYHFQYEIKNGQCNIVRMLRDEGSIS